jgi:hypothetical protein
MRYMACQPAFRAFEQNPGNRAQWRAWCSCGWASAWATNPDHARTLWLNHSGQ